MREAEDTRPLSFDTYSSTTTDPSILPNDVCPREHRKARTENLEEIVEQTLRVNIPVSNPLQTRSETIWCRRRCTFTLAGAAATASYDLDDSKIENANERSRSRCYPQRGSWTARLPFFICGLPYTRSSVVHAEGAAWIDF